MNCNLQRKKCSESRSLKVDFSERSHSLDARVVDGTVDARALVRVENRQRGARFADPVDSAVLELDCSRLDAGEVARGLWIVEAALTDT